MNPEDQVAALFAKANPVPSLDLLDPVESVDVDSLWERSESGGEMTVLKAPKAWHPGGPWLARAMAAVAIVMVVAIPVFINVTIPNSTPAEQAARSTPAEQVAIAFMIAANEYDGLAIRGMFALEHVDDFNPDGWVSLTDINEALGIEYTDVNCVEQRSFSLPDGRAATSVECSWSVQQDLARALGLEASTGDYFLFVSGGEIVRADETWDNPTRWEESFEEFRSWVQRTHPDDYWTLFTSPEEGRLIIGYYDNFMSVEPEALVLWERYVDEFVAEMGGR